MFVVLFGEGVGGLSNAFELGFALQVQKDGRFFNVAAFKHPSNYLITVQRAALFFEDFGDDISHGPLLIAPFFEGINTAADQHKALIFD